MDNEIIDLTDSFSLAGHHGHRSLANMIIELDTDDSFSNSFIAQTIEESGDLIKKTLLKKGRQSSITKYSKKDHHNLKQNCHSQSNHTTKEQNDSRRRSVGWGDCPICWDELGKNPLASTKCGHVYCMKCLERSLRVEKKCPTCRQVLKGSSAYHPLYLN